MASPLPIKSDLLRPLAALDSVQQGAVAYYRRLRGSADPVLAVAAWCALLDGRLVSPAEWEQLADLSKYGAIRLRAFAFFQAMLEPGFARRVAETEGASITALQQQLMLVELGHDAARAADLHGALYLETGDLNALKQASIQAELAGGWEPALQWALRMVAASPLDAATVLRVFAVLETSARPDLLQEVAEIFAARNMYLQIGQVFQAAAALGRGDAARCFALLQPLDDAKIKATAVLQPYANSIRGLRAAAEEKRGNYQAAYKAYVALNDAGRIAAIDPRAFFAGVTARARLVVPPLPAGQGQSVVQMLGFPRSGTTLLENALAAHPEIETFEEVPALDAAFVRFEQVANPSQADYQSARDRYFDQLASRSQRGNASVLIDKMPIRSADAAFIAKLFPEWRYIFSIRHPFDVVLSCFKQRFTPNIAMENFRTIEGAIRIYDFAMTEWFKQHDMDDEAVCYVRYDDLVTEFDPVIRRVIGFLGLEWDDAVRDFAAAAEKRSARTPSYEKVRQGLSIGVQSSWRNYGFLFDTDAAKPLHKWAEFFGYPTR